MSQWLTAARLGGPKALRSRPRRGRPLKLISEQKRLIPDFLWHGPEAYGFRGKDWTCPRVAKVLQEEFRVLYSKSQVSRLLKEIGWTPQVPLTRAIQRDEEAIQRWRVERWPSERACPA
jgi:transposase